jgi:hypothetical protein
MFVSVAAYYTRFDELHGTAILDDKNLFLFI